MTAGDVGEFMLLSRRGAKPGSLPLRLTRPLAAASGSSTIWKRPLRLAAAPWLSCISSADRLLTVRASPSLPSTPPPWKSLCEVAAPLASDH